MIRYLVLTALIAAPAVAQEDELDTVIPVSEAAPPGQAPEEQAPPAELAPTEPAAAEPAALNPAALNMAETPAAPAYRTERVTMQTEDGPLIIELEVERAPVTAKNFLRYVREGRFNGMSFYRATDIGRGYGLVQGGTRGNPKMILPPIPHEPTSTTGLSHTDGTISMAMGAPGTADGDFFIIVGDLISLDAENGQPGFAAFGRVVDGMDMVRTILSAPTDPNQGEGVMRGQMLADPVKILSTKKLN